MRRAGRLRAIALVLLLAAGSGATARADELDYRAENGGWNGLSELFALARGDGRAIEVGSAIDWDHLGPQDILLLMYPRSDVDPRALRDFVRSGGRLILADDFGRGGPLFAALDIEQRDFSTLKTAPRLWNPDHPNLPIAQVVTRDGELAAGLTEGIDEIVTNYPTVLTSTRHPVIYGFSPTEGVVIAGNLGKGKFVALGDPSLLINVMLGFDGNFHFATQLMRTMAPDQTADRIVVVVQEFQVKGAAPVAPPERPGLAGKVGETLVAFNGFLDEMNDYLAPDRLFRWIVLLLVIPFAIAAALLLSWARGARLDGRWPRPASAAARLDTADLLERYDDGRPTLPWNYPAALVRDDVERRLAGALGEPDPLGQPPVRIIEMLAHRVSAEAAAIAQPLLPRLRALPGRQQNAGAWLGSFITRKQFDTLHDDARALGIAIDRGLAARQAGGLAPPPPQAPHLPPPPPPPPRDPGAPSNPHLG